MHPILFISGYVSHERLLILNPRCLIVHGSLPFPECPEGFLTLILFSSTSVLSWIGQE